MHNYMLSVKADYDGDDITDHTLEVWGESQTLDYSTNLLQCLKTLAINPEQGRSAAEYVPQLKRFHYKAYTISYKPTENGFFCGTNLKSRTRF